MAQKKARESVLLLVPLSEAFALPILLNEQCKSPRRYVECQRTCALKTFTHKNPWLLNTTHPQGIYYCYVQGKILEFAKFLRAKNKRK